MDSNLQTRRQSLGIYVQVPFCASKCSFCNFSSRVEHKKEYDSYLDALLGEIERLRDSYRSAGIREDLLDLPVETLYVGGGTPSLLGSERLERLLGSIQSHFAISGELEFTLENTPGSADQTLLRELRNAGFNRLSIGAQSFEDGELAAVGRLHTSSETVELVRMARIAGFENINLDLIAGLPHQTYESWKRSLEAVAQLQPPHVSLYIFEIDEKSRLGKEVLHSGARYHATSVPSEDFMAEAYEVGCEFLKGSGYEQYEISNFARPGHASRHNLKYWQLAPYIGLGAGAHSFDGQHRWANKTDHRRYVESVTAGVSPVAVFRTLARQEQLEEFFFLGLRQCGGINLFCARAEWGPDVLQPWIEKIETLTRDGWLEKRSDRVRLTPRAYLVSNEIFQEFVSV